MDSTENEPGGRLSLVPARPRGVALVAQAHQEHAGVGHVVALQIRAQRRAGAHIVALAHPLTTVELTEARLVIEVLSPTTQHFDRADKLDAYRRLPGLQHILLLSSMEQAAWSCSRVPAQSSWSVSRRRQPAGLAQALEPVTQLQERLHGVCRLWPRTAGL